MARNPSVLVIGSGFAGIAAAIELTQHGCTDVTILEKAPDLGGVWRENTYPGAACDVPSPLYSFSFAPNPHWSKRYSPQPEILAYLKRVADEYGITPLIRFGVEVASADWDEARARWQVHTSAGETLEADVLVSALGQLSRPAWPRLPGVGEFAGPAFHSALWDHDVDLTGRRVAVIGTGASAIQLVPAVAPQALELTVFQRSAPWLLPQPQKEYRRVHHWLFEHVPAAQRFERGAIWLLVEVLQRAMTRGSKVLLPLCSAIHRLRLRRKVRDRALRKALTPEYPIGCKRILFTNAYLPALDAWKVRIVTDDVEAITPHGVRTADGVEHPADVLVYGTGFAAAEFLAPLTIRGVDGVDLHDVWSGGAHAHLGITVPGFPNLFLMYGPNTNLGSGSIIAMLEAQATYVRQAVQLLSGARSMQVRRDVERRFDEEIQARLRGGVWTRCDSWYRADDGRVTTNWAGTVTEYRRRTARLDPADFEIDLGAPVPA